MVGVVVVTYNSQEVIGDCLDSCLGIPGVTVVVVDNGSQDATRDQIVRLSACDPLNLAGILTPGERVPATLSNTVGLRDGVPLPSAEAEAIRHPRHRQRSAFQDSAGVSGASRTIP